MSILPDQDSDDPWTLLPSSAAAVQPESDRPALQVKTIEGVEPLDMQIGVFPKKTVPDALYDALFGQMEPTAAEIEATGGDPPMRTYAILDAAKVTNLPELLERSGLEYRCLFKGAAYDELKNVAPWIVRLEENNAFTRTLFTRSEAPWHLWDTEPGIYVRAHGTLDDMWRHFRKFTRVQDESGKWYYFRFWEQGTLGALANAPAIDVRWINNLLRHRLFISLSEDGLALLIRTSESPNPERPVGRIVFSSEIRPLLRRQLQQQRRDEDIRLARAQLVQLGHVAPVSDEQLGQVRVWIMECGITKRDHLIEAMSCVAIGFTGAPDSWPVDVRLLLSDRTRGPGVRVWYLRKQVLGDRG